MNTCPWRENRPGLIILEPRPAPEESLASVIIGKWCNTLYTPHWSVVTHGPLSRPAQWARADHRNFFPATRWLWRERRGGGGSDAARAQQVSTRAGAAAAAARASLVSWENEENKLNEIIKICLSRRKPGQQEILINKSGDIAPRARQWLAESVSAGVSCNVTKITLVTVMCSGLSWCWVTLRSCVTITSLWCCPKWRRQSTTPWSCGEYSLVTQTSNLFLQLIFLSSTWTSLRRQSQPIFTNFPQHNLVLYLELMNG